MKILCETSVRHVHLSAEHVAALFGEGHMLTPKRELSQPGQFLAEERVDLVTPKATLSNIAIIGPARPRTQVEISKTDTLALGLKDVPVRESGKLDNSCGIKVRSGKNEVGLDSGVIIARRHVHLDPKTAGEFGLWDGQVVGVRFEGERGGVLENTVVRVGENFVPAIHIDSDEANAMDFKEGKAEIVI